MSLTFGERVARLRQAHGLSRKELASRIHVSFETIRQIETGKIQYPRLHHVCALASVFKISLDAFCAEGEDILVVLSGET